MRKPKLGLMEHGRTLVGLCGAILLVMAVAGCGNSGNGSTPKPLGFWVPNYDGNTITEFTASTLKAGGTPSATLTNSGPDLNEPWDVTFDKHGNMWSTNYGGETITEYTASRLRDLKNTPAPSANVVISVSGSPGPSGLIFDKSGNLWVAYWTADEIVEFTPSQLAATGSPSPHVFLDSDTSGNNMDGPLLLTFGPSIK